jgi:hypothetical protein
VAHHALVEQGAQEVVAEPAGGDEGLDRRAEQRGEQTGLDLRPGGVEDGAAFGDRETVRQGGIIGFRDDPRRRGEGGEIENAGDATLQPRLRQEVRHRQCRRCSARRLRSSASASGDEIVTVAFSVPGCPASTARPGSEQYRDHRLAHSASAASEADHHYKTGAEQRQRARLRNGRG